MTLLAEPRLGVAEHLATIRRDELFQQLRVAIVQHKILISTDGTRISGADPALAYAGLACLARRIHALMIATVGINLTFRKLKTYSFCFTHRYCVHTNSSPYVVLYAALFR